MSKYLLFGFNDFYPEGGMRDIIAKFNTMEELEEELTNHTPCDNYQLVNISDDFKYVELSVFDIMDEDESTITITDEKRMNELKKWVSKNIIE